MKTHTLIVAVLSAGLLSGAPAFGQSTCNYSSWNPELYCFYGEKDKIIEKVSNLPAKLSERRVFLQITKGNSGSNVKLYERQKDNSFIVTEWSGKDTSQLVCNIDKAIMANKGVNCVGEQIKAVIVKALGKGKVVESVANPETSAAAFSHAVKEAKGEFIRTTIILAC